MTDRPGAVALPAVEGGYAVDFEDVTFGYHNESPVLKDFSLRVPRGRSVALVGPSGCGKSTILRLLFRFYDVNAGAVRVNGLDVRHLQLASLRSVIGVVPQDTVLFNDTCGAPTLCRRMPAELPLPPAEPSTRRRARSVFYNINYGKMGATPAEVYQVRGGAWSACPQPVSHDVQRPAAPASQGAAGTGQCMREPLFLLSH